MSDRRRARITAAIALALHAGVLVGVRAARVPERAVAAETSPTDEMEIAVIVPSGPEIETPVAIPLDDKPIATRSTGGWRPVEPAPAASSSESGAVRETDDRSGAPVALLVDPTPANIGIAGGGGRNPFLMNGPSQAAASVAPAGTGPREQSTDEAKRKVEASMRFSQRERDVSLGLGPDGPVLRALRDSTYSSLAPNKGKAVFLAIVDASGSIVDVKIISTNGDDTGWGDARERAKKALIGQKLALRGAKGAEVRIEVSSDVLLPSGNRPENFPVQPGLKPSKIDMSENAPSGPAAGTVQSWTVATFDLSDIGAKPRRIVHARVVEARFF